METYLPLFKTLFADWVQLTTNEPLYAGALAFIAWIVTASLYSIKIAFINKKSTARENARIDAINQLNDAQLKLKDVEQQLIESAEQLKKDQEWAQKETQRASEFENLLKDRNKQIATHIQSFSTSFDLGERPLPITEDLKAESVWQQFDRAINLFITRLRSEQQAKTELQTALHTETLKSTENEAVISTLQAGIAAQTIKISNLELLLEEQKNTFQQQQEHAQLLLNQSLANKPAEVAHNNTQTQTNIDLVNSQTSVNEVAEIPSETIAPIEPIIEIQSTPTTTVTTESIPNTVINEQPPVKSSKDQLGKLKGFFGKKKSTVSSPELPIDQQANAIPVEPIRETISTPIETATTETTSSPETTEQHPIKSSKDQLGKLKSLFGKATNKTTTPVEITKDQHVDVIIEQPSVEVVIAPEPVTIKPSKSPLKKMKYYFGEAKQSTEVEADIDAAPLEPLVIEPESISSDKFSFSKLKSIISKLP